MIDDGRWAIIETELDVIDSGLEQTVTRRELWSAVAVVCTLNLLTVAVFGVLLAGQLGSGR